MPTNRTAPQALAWALAESLRPTASFDGLCLRAVRSMLGIPALYPSAIEAWRAVPDSARSRTLPPPGKPIFWRVGEHGHVALSCGYGLCWSSDILRRGRLDVVPMAVIERRWGAYLLGWTTTLNGVDLAAR